MHLQPEKTGSKTLTEIADEYDIHRRTLYRWLKKEGIVLKNGRVNPAEQTLIYQAFGETMSKPKKNP